VETDRIRMETDLDISDNHFPVSFQTDRIRMETNLDTPSVPKRMSF
jgi:hypothetical protein